MINCFMNALGAWSLPFQILGWTLLVLVPVAILLLYFLKLRRTPIEVPSTYLWSKTIEDLHVNSIWQTLRRSLLLFLQLLLAGLLISSIWFPWIESQRIGGERFIFLIDTSASMAAKSGSKTRLQKAKESVSRFIKSMKTEDSGMIISFSDNARIEHSYTGDRHALQRTVDRIKQTNRRTNLDEALRAASGLANPSRINSEGRQIDIELDAVSADLYIFSDGGVDRVPDFNMGNLKPTYLAMGDDAASQNVGITEFSVSVNPENPDERQAFGRVLNGGSEPATFNAGLYINDRVRDYSEDITIEPGESKNIEFDLSIGGSDIEGVVKLQLDAKDDFEQDNSAYVVFSQPKRSKILLVTLQNEYLRLAMTSTETEKISAIDTQLPSYLKTDEYKTRAFNGFYDLIVYDQCSPEKMPECNTFFIAAQPPGEDWKLGPKQSPVFIVDTASTHPLMSRIDIRNVLIADGSEIEGPKGAAKLIDSNFGNVFAIASRSSYEDAVMGFSILDIDEKGDAVPNTDWTRYISFPLFAQNVVSYLGTRSSLRGYANVPPGETLQIRANAKEIKVTDPLGTSATVKKSKENLFLYTGTERLGVYDVFEGESKDANQRFAVNILDRRESDLLVAPKLEIGHEELQKAPPSPSFTRFDFWKIILVLGLVVLAIEWYIYNQRVYV